LSIIAIVLTIIAISKPILLDKNQHFYLAIFSGF